MMEATKNQTEKNQESVTKNTKSISTIKEAGLGWRVFSGIIDGVLFAFIWLILAMFVFTPIANAGMNYSYKMTLGSQYQIASHLFVMEQTNDDGKFETIEVRDFTEKLNPNRSQRSVTLYNYESVEINPYVKRIYYYYHNFKCNVNIELPNDTPEKKYDPVNDFYVDPEYENKIDGVDRITYYSNSWFLDKILNINSDDSFFIRDESINGLLPDQILLKQGKKKEDAVSYLKNKSYEAIKDQYYASYFYNNNEDIKRIQLFIIIPPYVISFGAIFFLIPLLRKDGATLGKMSTHLAIVTKDGYAVKRRQIIFRELILFFLITLSLVVVGIGTTSLATCGVMVLALFIFVCINKRHRGPHDLAAYTVVVDSKNSVWFTDAQEEAIQEQLLEEQMAKYKNVKIENKNLISVGTTIVDEDLKKEIEEEKSKK